MNGAAELPSGTWNVDAAATTVTVTAKKMGLFTVPATLAVTSGTIEIGEDHRVTAVEVTADASSYSSKNAKRNEHVRSQDFLDSESHPTITFQAERVAPAGSGYAATGTLTVKGQTSPIEVAISDVTVSGTNGSFTATAAIDRNAIGVGKMPSLIIGQNLQLSVAAKTTKS